MRSVNFKQVVQEILDAYDWNETELGARVGCTQQSINKLKNGKIVEPSYALGAKLVALHDAKPNLKVKK